MADRRARDRNQLVLINNSCAIAAPKPSGAALGRRLHQLCAGRSVGRPPRRPSAAGRRALTSGGMRTCRRIATIPRSSSGTSRRPKPSWFCGRPPRRSRNGSVPKRTLRATPANSSRRSWTPPCRRCLSTRFSVQSSKDGVAAVRTAVGPSSSRASRHSLRGKTDQPLFQRPDFGIDFSRTARGQRRPYSC